MRKRRGTTLKPAVCALVLPTLLLAGCSSSGRGPEPRLLPVALRGQSYTALAATYQVSPSSGYTALRDPSDPAAGAAATTLVTSAQGDSISLQVVEEMDNGIPVNASLELALPKGTATSSANFHYPAANANLSYMAYGEWMQPLTGTVQGGFFAFGNETPGAAIPLTGTATFSGAFHGKAIVGSALGAFATAIDGALTAQADFMARTVSISTTNNVSSSYNLMGTLTYDPGVNQLRGALTTPPPAVGLPFSGQAVGRFFGPNAEELGGAFRLTRSNPICIFSSCVWLQDAYVGSFGARR